MANVLLAEHAPQTSFLWLLSDLQLPHDYRYNTSPSFYSLHTTAGRSLIQSTTAVSLFMLQLFVRQTR